MNSWGRPRMKIQKTKSEWIWDIIGYSFFLGSIIFLITIWGGLPEEVPGHYNAKGAVDRWGSKWELFTLPGIGIFILLLMQTLEKFPEVNNYPQRFNESNAKQFYLNSRKMINQLKNVCLVIFALIQFETISIVLGWSGGLGKLFLPIIIIGTVIPIVIGIIRKRKIK
ncbi:putative membrane protein [Bacillus sp. RC240]